MTVFAPFRFAPIHRRVYFPAWAGLVSHDAPFKDGLSGEIDLEIEAMSPLLVGGRRRKPTDQQPGEVWPVQLPDGTYVLPGETLQGLARAALSVAAFGRLGPWVEKKRFGIRDLNISAKPFYQGRLTNVAGRNPVSVTPKVMTGWLRRVDNGGFELKRCAHARIEYADLVLPTTVPAGPVPVEPRRGDYPNNDEGFKGAKALYQVDYKNCRAWSKKSDVTERYGWVPPGALTGHTFYVDRQPPNDGYRHQRDTLRIFYKRASLAPQHNRLPVTNGRIVLTGNTSDPPRDRQDSSKHFEFLFYNEQPAEPLPNFEEKFQEFLSIHQPEDGRKINPNWEFFKNTGYPGEGAFEPKQKDAYPGGWMPIFYLPDDKGGIDSFGLAFMFKLAHQFNTHDMLRNSSPDHLDADDGEIDLPSLIFGVKAGEKGGLKRRAAFDLARAALPKNGKVEKTTKPTVLLGPKPSYYPLYVRQPATTPEGELPRGAPYATYTPLDGSNYKTEHKQPELAGVKIWPAASGDACNFPSLPTADEANNKVKLHLHALPKGTKFTTTLRFHNLRPMELGAVLWALTCGDSQALNGGDSRLRLRIGMGKPYGLGAARAKVTAARIAPNDRQAKPPSLEGVVNAFTTHMDKVYKEWSGGAGWADSVQVKALLKAADPAQNPAGSLKYMDLGSPRGGDGTYIGERKASRFLVPYVGRTHELPMRQLSAASASPSRQPVAQQAPAVAPFAVGSRVRDRVGGQGQGKVVKAPNADGEVRVRFDDGSEYSIPTDELEQIR